MTPNQTYRLLVAIPILALCIYHCFYDTPELNGVKNNYVYRISYLLLLMRGSMFILFDMFGLFPLE